MEWSKLDYGPLSREEIRRCTDNKDWQKYKKQIKGKPLAVKYELLLAWVSFKEHTRCAEVQVTNYVNALKRGGNID